MRWYRSACSIVALAWSVPAAAQHSKADPGATVDWLIAPYVGFGNNSPVGSHWGITPDRDHVVLGVHLSAPVARIGVVSFRYAPAITPLIIVTNNPEWVREGQVGGGVGYVSLRETGRSPVYGTGFAPVGVELAVAGPRGLVAYGNGGVGGVWFSRNMPRPEARRFNYTFDFGGGLRLHRGRRLGLQLGYKFLHISNAYTAQANPGVDANILYGGAFWVVRVPR